jgi:ABC-type uncharacterized transport system involved in gliding motility auxiliary subunit
MQSYRDSHSSTRVLALLGLITLFAGLVLMLLLPDIKLATWGIMVLGVILLVSALILDFRKVSGALTGRRGRFGAGTTLMASIFVGITLLVNGISVSAYQRYDVTRLSQFTLTQQTKDILTSLDQPVKAICFFVPSKDTYGLTTYAVNLLAEYQRYSKELSIEIVDPDQHPERARTYNISQYQTVIFESGDKRRQVLPTQIIQFSDQGLPEQVEAEHSFTSAILEVIGKVQKKVYFVIGHGEANLNGNYSSVLRGLRDNLYVVGTLDLMANPVIPDDTSVLVIASPRTTYTDAEIIAVDNYLIAGGQALILADPGFPEFLNQIITPWGVSLDDGMVIDRASQMANRNDEPRVTADRDFFGGMGLNIVSYFPGAVGVTAVSGAEDTWPPLVYTSTDSWLDKDYDATKEPTFDDQQGDVKGPIAIGVLVAASLTDNQTKNTRIIVMGDSDFAANENYAQVNNSDLFLNSISWLAEETDLISIHRSALPFRRLSVNTDEANFITYSSLLIPPILVLLIGGIVLWYRRS